MIESFKKRLWVFKYDPNTRACGLGIVSGLTKGWQKLFMCGLYICWNWSATIYFHPFLNATSKFFFCIIQLDCYAMCWWSCSYAFTQSYKEDSSLCTKFRNKSFPWSIPCWSALVWECIAQWGILPIWENAETVNGFGLSHTFAS